MTRLTWMYVVCVGVLVGITGLGLSACGEGQVQEQVIILGGMGPLTGRNSTFGQSTQQGIQLAESEINAQGGVLGKQVRIIFADTESRSDRAALAAGKLINEDKVVGIIGSVTSGESLGAAAQVQQARIPMLSPTSTNPKVTQQGDFIFRSCFNDTYQGRVIATYAARELKHTRAAILKDIGDDYSTGLADAIRAEFIRLGGQIVAEESYSSSEATYKTQLTKIADSKPEIIFTPIYYSAGVTIIRQARELGITVPFMGGDGLHYDETITLGGKDVEGSYVVSHFINSDPDPKVQKFVADYRAKFSNEPNVLAALGYDAAKIMFAAIQRAGTTEGTKLREILAQTTNYPGVTGVITFDAQRNAQKSAVVLTIQAGKFEMLKRIAPDPQ